jgi:NADPH:quinone reductase-like Zn-dependent oxidoreductase
MGTVVGDGRERSKMEGTAEMSGVAYMKAAVCDRYGPPEVIQVREVEKPVPKDDEVLIEVCAASVNPLDCGSLKGRPYLVRLMTGLRKPKSSRPGVDVAGRVESVGRTVTQFKAGDEVFGACISDPHASGTGVWTHRLGSFAEYVCAPEPTLAMKPDNVTFEQAATAPVAGFTALQGLRDKGQIQPGQKVLIHGAAGGVGTFAVQIAKSFGAEVTGVCSTRNVEMVRSIGADHVIDYTQEDFTKSGIYYDLLFDCVGNHPVSACLRVLNPKGAYLMVGEMSGRGLVRVLSRLIRALILSRFVSQRLVVFLARPTKEDLILLHDLMKAGKVMPVIDKRYRLSEVSQAIRYVEEKHARGKVVIALKTNNKVD